MLLTRERMRGSRALGGLDIFDISMVRFPFRFAESSIYRLLKKTQRRGAGEIDPSARSGQAERRRIQPVRRSEPIERNEAYESFSAAC